MQKKVISIWRVNHWLYPKLADAEKNVIGDSVLERVLVGVPEDWHTDDTAVSLETFNGWVFVDQSEAEEAVEEHNGNLFTYIKEAYYFRKTHSDIDMETPDGLSTVAVEELMSVEQFRAWCEAFIQADFVRKGQLPPHDLALNFAPAPQKPIVSESLIKAVSHAFELYGQDGVLQKHVEDPSQWTDRLNEMKCMDAVLLAKLLYVGFQTKGDERK